VILNDIPDHIDVSRLTGMAQPVAEIDHLLPLDIRGVRRLAGHFEVSLGRILSAANRSRLLPAGARLKGDALES
jgi:hypothetical protein